MSALQAALLSKPPSFPSFPFKPCRFPVSSIRLRNSTHPVVFFSCRRPRAPTALASPPGSPNSAAEPSSFPSQDWISDLEKRDDTAEFAGGRSSGEVDTLAADTVALVEAETEKDGVRDDSSDDGSGAVTGKQANATEFSLAAFMMGVFFSLRKGFEKLAASEWLSWWPFWRQEKRLERLLAEADANPKDAAKQTALLVELNKHSPESVIKRFEQRDHAVDSRGVAEYLRALVVTNAIAEYLPDEQSGRPSNLPTL